MSEDCKIEINVPLIKDSRKGGKLTNPLYLIAKKMEIGDSIKFPLPEFAHANYVKRDEYTDDEWNDALKKEANFNYWNNALKTLRRYLIELYGKGSVAERNLYNIPEKKKNASR